jgi:hypothetical protein
MLAACGLCACQAPVVALPPALPARRMPPRGCWRRSAPRSATRPAAATTQCRTLPIGAQGLRRAGGLVGLVRRSTRAADRLQGWARKLEHVERERQARAGAAVDLHRRARPRGLVRGAALRAQRPRRVR